MPGIKLLPLLIAALFAESALADPVGEARLKLDGALQLQFKPGDDDGALFLDAARIETPESGQIFATGKAHWELLLRARAVENLAFVAAPAQGGLHENGRRTWGHSMIVDPWGEVLAVRPEGEGVVLAELDAARIAEVRSQLPALTHRRL